MQFSLKQRRRYGMYETAETSCQTPLNMLQMLKRALNTMIYQANSVAVENKLSTSNCDNPALGNSGLYR
jgi:hypothetical protein